jgi:alpha-L-fucosidase
MMKKKTIPQKINQLIVATTLMGGSILYAEDDNFEIQEFKVDKSIKLPTAPEKAREAWKNNRFGMFIHWGPISQMGKQLSHSRNSPSHHKGGKPYKKATIQPEVYDAQYKTFNPVKFDPEKMIKLAKSAGIAYVVFTTKHHAGFSMFDSKVTDYDIMNTPYKKDITKMISDACHKNGVNFGFYYSPRDWHHPDCDSAKHHDRYIKFFKAQMYELLTKYGPIYEIWFDGLGPGKWGDTSKEVMSAIRKLQPDAMVNDRGGAGADFYTPEHDVSYFNRKEFWEACHTTTGQWGYNPSVHAKKLNQLMEILLYTWGSDGNMLLNIGPMGNGAMNPEELKRFQQLAEWWKEHGEKSIRNSRGGPYIPGPWGVSTCKDNSVFLHIFRWPENEKLHFPALDKLKLKSASLLSGKKIDAVTEKNGFTITVPKADREKIVTTIKLTFDGKTLPIKPLSRVSSLTKQAKLTASHNQNLLKNLTDQDASTHWNASLKKGEKEFWIEADFEKPVTIGSFYVARGDEWSPKFTAAIQIPDGDKGWKTITPKKLKLKWEPIKFLKKPVTTKKIRLLITNAKKFICAEFELYPPVK